MAFAWLALAVTAGASKVSVELFAEAGCPFCRAAIAGPVKATLAAVGGITDPLGGMRRARKGWRSVEHGWEFHGNGWISLENGSEFVWW